VLRQRQFRSGAQRLPRFHLRADRSARPPNAHANIRWRVRLVHLPRHLDMKIPSKCPSRFDPQLPCVEVLKHETLARGRRTILELVDGALNVGTESCGLVHSLGASGNGGGRGDLTDWPIFSATIPLLRHPSIRVPVPRLQRR
jgi:hypothetical protein